VLSQLTQQLAGGEPLNAGQITDAVRYLVEATIAPDAKADFLSALAKKGETIEEIAGFARELRALSIIPTLDEATRSGAILDVVGTGGDQMNTFNISTTAALICAAAGVTVAKHGNRAATSKCGSADVLEALGIPIELPPEAAVQSLRRHQFAFFFAPRYHPAFKHIAPARKLCAERGQRTLFNFLGPLLNPARPSAQLMGVPRPEWCEPLAKVLQSLGVRRGMVVCGQVGSAWVDELSTLGDNTVAEFYQDHGFAVSTLSPAHFHLQPAKLADLAGGDKPANAAIIRDLFAGRERGPKRDATLLNAGAALFVAGKARTISDGWELAARLIDEGAAARKLSELIDAAHG
jgi:anthranilate phosphoribosyltransferase